jgi:PhnB protein
VNSVIYPYLSFNGNCREAMSFYQQCLGGNLQLQTIEDTPASVPFPPAIKEKILQAVLKNKKFALFGSDMLGEDGLQPGNRVSILFSCSTEKELRSCYAALSREGKKLSPIRRNNTGGLTGMLSDRYNVHWFLLYSKQKSKRQKRSQ